MIPQKGKARYCQRRVSRVNSKTVKHDARKTVFIRVGAERDAIIPLKLHTANNAGRCVASYVINALATRRTRACVRTCVPRTRVRRREREMIFKRRRILPATMVAPRARKYENAGSSRENILLLLFDASREKYFDLSTSAIFKTRE